MKPIIKNGILFVLATFFLVLTGLAGTLFYLYRHPASIKPFIEKAVSRAAGASLTIDDLSYSLRPLRIQGAGIRLEPGEALKGVTLHIPAVTADMAVEGPFSHRRLVFRMFKIDDLSLVVSQGYLLPRWEPGKQGSPWIFGVLSRLFAFLVFRDVEFQAVELSGRRISSRTAGRFVEVSGIRAGLTPERLIEITCDIRFDSISRGLYLTASQVRVTTEQVLSLVDPEIKGHVAANEITFKSATLDIPAAGCRADLVFHRDLNALSFAPIELALKGAALKRIVPEPAPPLDVDLEAEGSFNLTDLEARLSSFHLTVGEILATTGRLEVDMRGAPAASLDFDCRLAPERLRPLLPSTIRRFLAPGTLTGPVFLEGRSRAALAGGRLDLDCEVRTRLVRNPFSYVKDGIQVQGEISAEIEISGAIPDLGARAEVVLNKTTLSAKGATSGPMNVGLKLVYQRPVIRLTDLEARSPRLGYKTGGKEIVLEDCLFQAATGSYDLDKGDVHIPGATLDTSLLKNLELSFMAGKTQKSFTLKGRDSRLLDSAGALALFPEGWQFTGIDSIEARAMQKMGGDWSVDAALTLQDLTLENRDASCMGEGISLNARVKGIVKPDLSNIQARGSLDADAGEILLDRFYFNLAKNQASIQWEGAYVPSRKTFDFPRLSASLKDIAALSVKGVMSLASGSPDVHMSLNMPRAPVSPLFQHFLLDPFKLERPILTALAVEGDISGDLDFVSNGVGVSAKGTIQYQEGRLASEAHGVLFRDIDLRLPVWYQSGTTWPPAEPLNGMLDIGAVHLPLLPEQALKLTLQAGPNSISLKGPFPIGLEGGVIDVGAVSCRISEAAGLIIETSLAFDDFDLGLMLSPHWAREIQGTMNGKLTSVNFQNGRLRTQGEILAHIFGGRITLSDLGASGVLTPAPVFRLNAEYEGLHLSEMTRDTAFGQIEGLLKGHVRDFEIAYGQPQRFDLLLETEKMKGVSQRISVKALDNIARIGGGQSPFMGLAGAFTSFFKEFPYEKIGVRASLENDVFALNGTIIEGGVEYLVKRSSFSGVNVVNQNPDNRISFKDMVTRIKRVTTSKSGPVIR